MSRPYSTPSARWAALTIRDPAADTQFIYGVRSTKIYCRPICPARLARRANVDFFDTPEQAIVAGFRACKRCKPETVSHFDTVDEDKKRRRDGIQRAIELMQHKKGQVTLEAAAKEAGIGGKWHFLRKFKEITGETPGAMTARLRNSQSPGSHQSYSDNSVVDFSTPGRALHVNSTSEQAQDPLDVAWMTTDLNELEKVFQDMFPLEATLDSPLFEDKTTQLAMPFNDLDVSFHSQPSFAVPSFYNDTFSGPSPNKGLFDQIPSPDLGSYPIEDHDFLQLLVNNGQPWYDAEGGKVNC